MDKQKLAILLAVIGTIGAVGGGSYALDFSNTQTTTTDNSNNDNSQTIINEGDTIINEIIQEVFEPDGVIDLVYDEYCEEINPDSEECDWYWEDWE